MFCAILLVLPMLALLGKTIDIATIFVVIITTAIITPLASWQFIQLIAKIHDLEKKQRYLASHDELTNVMTRREFFDHCQTVYSLSYRNNASLSLAYIDFDNFKILNDTYGHPGGDEVLKVASQLIKDRLRDSDLFGRIGGEEFAIALPNTRPLSAYNLLVEISELIKDYKILFEGAPIRTSISIGITTFEEGNRVSFAQLNKQADNAMYAAKHAGKGEVIVHDQGADTANESGLTERTE
ncbi:MAG: GGDEF domain-containing protein [Pseudomonadota bacterium]